MNSRTPGNSDSQRLESAGNSVRLKVTAFGVVLGAIGLLLWARFLIVTNHPRTAIAEPPKQSQAAEKHNHAPKDVVDADEKVH